jgi:SnoaL-like domain
MTEADVLTRLLHAVDALDWATVRGALADEVAVDYTSMTGGEPETLAAGDLIARWQGLLPGFDVTQHLTGPVVLTDDGGPGVRANTHLVAYHRLTGADGGESWVLHGHYTARLVDGKVAGLTLTVLFQDGNLDLPRLAAERAASGSGR